MIDSVPYLRASAAIVLVSAVVAAATVLPAAPAAARAHPIVVAHRNGAAYAPENTLAAAERAYRMRVGWLETDVQRTRDGRLILMHDSTLRRTTNVEKVYPDLAPWRVRDLTLHQIERLDAGGWFGRRYRGERVPTLGRYLRMLDRTGQAVLLEIKSPDLYPGLVPQVAVELRKHGWLDRAHRSRLMVQSFDAGAVHTFHRLEPKVPTAVIGTPRGAALHATAKYADAVGPRYTDVSEDYVRSVHALRGAHGDRMRVLTWTVDSRRVARRVAGDGVDGVITDHPGALW